MAINIPSGCYRQPTETVGTDANGSETFAYVLKGPYSTLENLRKTLRPGMVIVNGWVMSSDHLARNPGNTGTLTITCAKDADESDETVPTENATKALDETWTLRSVRNDVSILAYCGPGDDNPCREWIEAWQKEPDGELARHPGFTKPDGTVFKFGGGDQQDANRATATRDLLAKIRKGIESVMRFYPQLTRTRTYSKPPARVYENLSTIDKPSVGSEADFAVTDEQGNETTIPANTNRLKKPGNLDEIIDAHSWLKCQDDCVETGDGKFQRIESWIGVVKSDGGWDENLYGDATMNRWEMPYSHVKQGNS